MVTFFKRILSFFSLGMNPDHPSPMEYVSHNGGATELKKIKMNVQGKVQGVGFRQYTKQLADEMGIFGIVRNEEDGTVYCEAVGTSEKIDRFIQEVRISPAPLGKVTHLSVREDPQIEEYTSFEITY